MNELDLSIKTIRELFHKQMMEMTKKSTKLEAKVASFDLQFSDRWIDTQF